MSLPKDTPNLHLLTPCETNYVVAVLNRDVRRKLEISRQKIAKLMPKRPYKRSQLIPLSPACLEHCDNDPY